MEEPLDKPAFSCTRAGGIIRPVAIGRFRSIASLGAMAFMERVVRETRGLTSQGLLLTNLKCEIVSWELVSYKEGRE